MAEDGAAPGSQLVRPLQPAAYPVAASGDPAFVVDGDRAEPTEYAGTSVVRLTQPTLGNVSFDTAPAIGSEAEDVTNRSRGGNTDTEAAVDGDFLIARIEASGLDGALYAEEADADRGDVDVVERLATLTDDSGRWAGEGISFDIAARAPAGQNQSVEALLAEAPPDTVDAEYYRSDDLLVVAVDTAEAPFERSLPESWNLHVNLSYDATNGRFEFYAPDERPTASTAPPSAEVELPSVRGPFGAADGQFDEDDPEEAYPYLRSGRAVAQATIPVVKPTIDFADTTDGTIRLDSDTAVIGGSTPLADGTQVKVSVTSQQVSTPFERTTFTEVTEGTILTQVSLPEVPEQTPAEVTVSTPNNPDRLTVRQPAVIGPPPEETDEADTSRSSETDTPTDPSPGVDVQAPSSAAPGAYVVVRTTVPNRSVADVSPVVTVEAPSGEAAPAGAVFRPWALHWPPPSETTYTAVRLPEASNGTVVQLPVSARVDDEVYQETVTVRLRADDR